jgi:DeoR family fructose operon transcriptional repressor
MPPKIELCIPNSPASSVVFCPHWVYFSPNGQNRAHGRLTLLAEERRLQLLAYARSEGRVDAADAAERLHVAVETIRRDLELLQRQGVMRRVHGGGILVDRFPAEYSVAVRRTQNSEIKSRIAEVASQYIPSSGTIIIDAGTTTEYLAPYLRDKSELTVVTNSLNLSLAIGESKTNVIVIGGRIRPITLSTVGTLAMSSIGEIFASVAFLATNGIDAKAGLTTPDIEEAEVKRSMVRNSQECIVLADSTKFGQRFGSRFADLDSIDRLVTDINAPSQSLETLRAFDLEVVLA